MPGLAHVMPDATYEAGYIFGDDSSGVKHPGVDLNIGDGDADRGVAILCFADGEVDGVYPWDGVTKGFGNHVRVRHTFADGTEWWTHYCHLDAFSPGLTAGMAVEAGYILGKCGKSGGWDWSHLHFQCEKVPLKPDAWPVGRPLKSMQSLYMDPRTLLYVATCGGFPQSAQSAVPLSPDDLAILELSHGIGKTAAAWDEVVKHERALELEVARLTEEVNTLRPLAEGVKRQVVELVYSDGEKEVIPA